MSLTTSPLHRSVSRATRRARFVCFAGAVIIATAAAAQDVPGRPPLNGGTVPRWVAAQRIGGCVVRTNHKAATRFVLAGLAPTDTTTAVPTPVKEELKYAVKNCLHADFRSIHLAGVEFRGVMAEALLKENDAALLGRARTTPPRAPQRTVFPVDNGPRFALFGCAVAAEPARAAAMLDTEPNSPAELTAFQALAPALQACAPAATEVHITPGNVRWLVATSLYHLVQPGT